MKKFQNRTVFFQWFLSYLVMMGLVGILSFGLYFYSYSIISGQSEEIIQTMLEKIKVDMDGHFGEAHRNLTDLMLDQDVQKAVKTRGAFRMGDRELLYEIHGSITNKWVSNSEANHIFLYFKEGDTIISEKGHMDLKLYYDLYYQKEGGSLEAFRKMLEQDYSNEVTVVRNALGQQEVWLLQSALPRGQKAPGTLGVSITEDTLAAWMDEMRWDDTLEIGMVHPDGIFIGSHRMTEELAELDGKILEEEGTGQETGTFTGKVEASGGSWQITAIPSAETGFFYVVLSPLGRIAESARKIQLFMIGGFFLCLALGIAAAYILTGIHYHPLRHIMDIFGSYGKDGRLEQKNELQWLLDRSEGMAREYQDMKSRFYDNSEMLKSQFLYRLITLPYEEKSGTRENAAVAQLSARPDNLVLLLYLERKVWEQQELYLFILSNVLKELMQGQFGVEMVELKDCIACVINGEDRGNETKEMLEGIWEQLQRFVKERMQMNLGIACGSFREGMEGIYESYRTAREASDYRELTGESEVV